MFQPFINGCWNIVHHRLFIALLHHVQQWHVGIKGKVMVMFVLLANGLEITDFASMGDTLVLFQQFLAATLAHYCVPLWTE